MGELLPDVLDKVETPHLSFSKRALGGQNQMECEFVTKSSNFSGSLRHPVPSLLRNPKSTVCSSADGPNLLQEEVWKRALWIRHSIDSFILQTWSQTLIQFLWVDKKESIKEKSSRWTKGPTTYMEQAGDVTTFSVCFWTKQKHGFLANI